MTSFLMTRSFLLFFKVFSLLKSAMTRTDFVDPWIETAGGGKLGVWGAEMFCPDNTFAIGYQQQTDKSANPSDLYDPTALNALRFICNDLIDVFVAEISNEKESLNFGVWFNQSKCPKNNIGVNYLKGYKVKVGSESYGALGVKIICLGGEEIEAPGTYQNTTGVWTDWGICHPGTAMCGLQSKMQAYQGSYYDPSEINDDSALNHIRIACCRLCEYDQGLFLNGNKCSFCFYKCKKCLGGGSNQCSSCFFQNSHPHQLAQSTCTTPTYELQISYDYQFNDWTAQPTQTLINCGYLTNFLTDLNNIGPVSYIQKQFQNIPPYFRLRILARIIKIDDWVESSIELYLNTKLCFTKTFLTEESVYTGSQCGLTSPEKVYVLEFESFEAYTKEVTIKLSSNLLQTVKGSWGFKEFALSVLKCHSSCSSCLDEKITSCLSCYDNAIKNTDNTCTCKETFFQELIEPCTRGICSVCNSCYKGCKKCKGTEKYDCESCIDGYIYVIDEATSKNICKDCSNDCFTCSGIGESKCLTCKAPFYHELGGGIEGLCVNDCPSNRYRYRNENTCVKICPEGFWLNLETKSCEINCAYENQYKDGTDRICKICDGSCAKCSGPANSACLTCSGNRYLQNNYCLYECEEGNYGDSLTNTCKNCLSDCAKCKTPDGPNICLSCKNGLYLSLDKCVSECKSNEFILNSVCTTCPSTCLSCSSNQFCKTCYENYFLTKSNICATGCEPNSFAYKPQFKCLDICLDPQKGNTRTWTCDDKCELINQYADPIDRICKNCYSTCSLCSGPLKTDCVKCEGSKFLTLGECLEQCPDTFYGSLTENKCLKCSQPCLSCKTPDGPSFCLSCKEPLYLRGNNCESKCLENEYPDEKLRVCSSCSKSCLSCSGSSSSECTSCESPFLLTLNNTCLEKCPENSFAHEKLNKCLLVCVDPLKGNTRTWTCITDCEFSNQYMDLQSRICINCHASCATCSGPLATDCLKCGGSKFLTLGECLERCPDTYYGSLTENKCLKCSEPCLSCKTPDGPSLCLSCKEPLYLRGNDCESKCLDNEYPNEKLRMCSSCSKPCLSCTGPSNSECTTCESPLLLTLDNNCLENCPENSFAHEKLKKCLLVCVDPLKGNTRTWTCITDCEFSNQYMEIQSRICKNCHASCATCSGPQATDCTRCEGNRYIWKGECLLNCPDGLYGSSKENKCLVCSESCKTCRSPDAPDTCESCNSPLFLKQNLCIAGCGDKEFQDNSDRTCKSCDQTCLKCSEAGPSGCTNCLPPLVHEKGETLPGKCLNQCPTDKFLFKFACFDKCPDGVWGRKQSMTCEPGCLLVNEYKDPVTQLCKLCYESCSKCDEYGINSCLICKDGFYRDFELGKQGECLKNCPIGKFLDKNILSCVFLCVEPMYALAETGLCNSQCPEGSYGNRDERTCEKCHSSCISCFGSSSDNCITCAINLYFYNGECLDNCPEGNYGDITDITKSVCKPCHSTCRTCTGGEASQCLTCANRLFYRQSDSSCVLCNKVNEVREVRDSIAYCLECKVAILGCLECSSNQLNCAKCEPNLYLFDSNNDGKYETCTECGRPSFFREDTFCKLCASSIDGCQECREGSDSCLLCQEGLYRINVENKILCTECETSTAIKTSNLDCALCSELILGCSECDSMKTCLVCQLGFLLYNNTCVPDCQKLNQILLVDLRVCQGTCPSSGYYIFYNLQLSQATCEKCDAAAKCFSCIDRANKCTSCVEGLFLNIDSTCSTNCPEGYHRHLIEGICTPCPMHQFDKQIEREIDCVDCQKPCKTCIGASKNCTSCVSGLFFTNGQCQKNCPQGTYPNDTLGICKNCIGPCKECTNRNSCTKCQQKYFLYKGSCLERCPNRTFPDHLSNVCKPCHFSCKNCEGPNVDNCFDDCESSRTFNASFQNQSNISVGKCLCTKGFFEKGEPLCIQCHFACKACTGPSYLECIECAGNRGDNNSLPIDGACECPSNFYDYMKPMCLGSEKEASTISMIKNQQTTFSYASIGTTLGFGTLKIFGFLFNVLEVAQEISLYSFININKPLNLEDLLVYFNEFKFYKHISFFQKLKLPLGENKNKTVKPQPIYQEAPPSFRKKGISSSFASNCLSVIIVIILGPLFLLLAMKIISYLRRKRQESKEDNENYKIFKSQSLRLSIRKLWNKRDSLMVNIILMMFLGSLQEIQMFMVLQEKNISFENSYNTFSFILSIFWCLYELIIVTYLAKKYFDLNPRLKAKFNLKRRFYRFLSRKAHKTNTEILIAAATRKDTYSDQVKESQSFFFGMMLKETPSGMTFIFYRIAKKIILPTIHVSLHEDVETLILFLISFYGLSFLYLRIAEPFQHRASNIVAEVTELGHINFLLLLKFYVKAVDLRNSELALTLGLYMIYSLLAIVFMNLCFLILTLTSICFGKLRLAFKQKRQDIRVLIRKIIGKKETVIVELQKPVDKEPDREVLDDPKFRAKGTSLGFIDNPVENDELKMDSYQAFSKSYRKEPDRLSVCTAVMSFIYVPNRNTEHFQNWKREQPFQPLNNSRINYSQKLDSNRNQPLTRIRENEEVQKKETILKQPLAEEKGEQVPFEDILHNLKLNLKDIGLHYELSDFLKN